MPTYTFKNTNTEEVFDKFTTIAEMEEMLQSGEFIQIIGSPKIVSGVGNPYKNTPDGFKDVLRAVKKNNPGCGMEIN
jgi:hypothetical protein